LQGQDNNEGREEDRVQKWAAPVLDESAERIESVKAGVLSAVVGSIAMAPIGMCFSNQSSVNMKLLL